MDWRVNCPENIQRCLSGETLLQETVGFSGAQVWVSERMVLKIEPKNAESDNQMQMLRFLEGKLPVPGIIAEAEQEKKQWLLMERLPGKMACAREYLCQPNRLVKLLVQGLHMLWSVDPTGCPCDQRPLRKLENARYQVAHGLYDLSNVDPETFGPSGFDSPAHLLRWLEEHVPQTDAVLSHGDYCLPNVFFQEHQVSGFLDLGRGGIADRYADIALCWRSLRDNYNGTHGYHDPSFDPDILFRELGIDPDWEKIRYYLLMDELF